jgi:cytochrome oxidase Cu insertion factor (SCO1/SenC/PrrC family)
MHPFRSGGTRRRTATLAVFVACLLATSCGGSSDEASTAPSTTAAPAGDVLPASTFEVTATTVDGDSYDLSQLAGTDVILWFWAPW